MGNAVYRMWPAMRQRVRRRLVATFGTGEIVQTPKAATGRLGSGTSPWHGNHEGSMQMPLGPAEGPGQKRTECDTLNSSACSVGAIDPSTSRSQLVPSTAKKSQPGE